MKLRIAGGKTGAGTKVYVDDKQLLNCRAVKFEASARGLSVVTLEIYPDEVEIEVQDIIGNFDKVKPE